jgi:succinylarginine dihydrolase
VSGTDIFARVAGEREYLAYQMSFRSDQQTAMILPIPVAADAGEGAVHFLTARLNWAC